MKLVCIECFTPLVLKDRNICCVEQNVLLRSNELFYNVWNMIEAYLSACCCVIARSLLNVFDRKVMRSENNDFLISVFLNALFPFTVALMMGVLFGREGSYTLSLLTKPGVILSALGSHFAAYSFFLAFRVMQVRTLAISSKLADLIIPLATYCLTLKFNIVDYLFSNLTVCIFLPILFMAVRSGGDFLPRYVFYIIYSLVFQSIVNTYYEMHQYADDWPKFLSLMTGILFWRTVYITLPVLLRVFQKWNQIGERVAKREVLYFSLFFRAILAFFAQATFFYSITRVSNAVAWPVLNATPLAACFMAHLFLEEKVGKTEIRVLFAFIILSFIYVYYYWGIS